MAKIYVTVYGRDTIAGSAYLGAVYFSPNAQIYSPTERFDKNNLRRRIEDLEFYLDCLMEDRDYFYLTQEIPMYTLEREGFDAAVSKRFPLLASELKYKHRLNVTDKDWILSGSEMVGNLFYNARPPVDPEETSLAFFAESLLKWYQMWSMGELDPIYSEYSWISNYGHKSSAHLQAILKHGPINRLHRQNAYILAAHEWSRLVVKKDSWALEQPWLDTPPDWWAACFPKYPFYYFLTQAEVDALYKELKGYITEAEYTAKIGRLKHLPRIQNLKKLFYIQRKVKRRTKTRVQQLPRRSRNELYVLKPRYDRRKNLAERAD